jgi:hypothetical protein
MPELAQICDLARLCANALNSTNLSDISPGYAWQLQEKGAEMERTQIELSYRELANWAAHLGSWQDQILSEQQRTP